MVKEAKERKRAHACPRCDSTFTCLSKRDRHVRAVHEKRRDHACPHCAAAFGEASDLTRHVRAMHEKRRYHECPHCNAAFADRSHLSAHCKTAHRDEEPPSKDRVCGQDLEDGTKCKLIFTDNKGLDRHVAAVHQKIRNYKCSHCSAAFFDSRHRDQHVHTVHEKRRDHACPYCMAAFGAKRNLTTHVHTVHEKRKDHLCLHCAATFSKADHLAKHLVNDNGKCAGDARQQQIAKRNEENAKHDELKAQTAKEKAEEKAARAARAAQEKAARAARAAQEKAARDNVKDAMRIARRICRSGEPFQGTFDLAPIKADELMEVFHCAVGRTSRQTTPSSTAMASALWTPLASNF